MEIIGNMPVSSSGPFPKSKKGVDQRAIKQFSDNPGFKKWLPYTTFRINYEETGV